MTEKDKSKVQRTFDVQDIRITIQSGGDSDAPLPDIEPRCEYCEFGKAATANEIVCSKFGVFRVFDSCRSFRYDLRNRKPEIRAVSAPNNINPDKFKL